MGGVGDGQRGGVPPETAAGEQGRTLAPHDIQVVAQLEKAPAGRAFEPIVERIGPPAVDADEAVGEGGGGGHAGPPRSSMAATISSMRWRSVCSASARRRAFSPSAAASSGWAR